MSQPSSPARAPEPARDPASAPPGGGGQAPPQQAPDQAWKIAALAVALVVLAILLFFLFTGPTVDQTSAPAEDEAEYAEEEEAEEPDHAPPPPAMADDPRPSPSARPSSPSSEGSSQPASPLPPMNVLSVGYSPMPALRVVALRIGGALPYFLHEGDTIGAIKILSIMQDRVHISHNGKTYEIRVGGDGKPVGEPKLVR
jgi:hypothetical protein